MRDARKVDGVAASPSDAVVAPSREAMRDAIAADTCPFCGAGPYKNLGQHTNKTHGISAVELREMSGLDRVCSLAFSDGSRERLVGRPDFAEVTAKATKAAVEAGAQAVGAAAAGAKQLAANAALHAEIVRMYNAGREMGDIASKIGVCPATVRRTLKREGLYEDGRARRWRSA